MATTITPILPEDYRKEIGPKVWHWDQIYFGPDISKYDDKSILSRYVPVVNDIILHPSNGDWVVGFVSERYIPSLRPRNSSNNDVDINDTIVAPSSSYNRRADVMHVDTSSVPVRFNINGRIWINGSLGSHYKVFSGTNTKDASKSIGMMLNANGAIISDNIPLELIAFSSGVKNLGIKAPVSGYLREIPLDGDLVTIAAYTKDGVEYSAQTLVVSHQNFIASNSAISYITDISLDTPYLSSTDSSVIEIPRNLTLTSLALFATLTYNDGSRSARMPVNGTKFSLLGAEAFTASNDLQSVGVVLAYNLADNETAVGVSGQGRRTKTKGYTLRTIPSDAAYSVKLFVLPVWNKTTSKWTLRYMLYDMRRDIAQDVTSLVEPNSQYAFNPNLFNQKQTVQVAINLQNIGAQYQFYRPVQVFYITLLKNGSVPNVTSYYNLSYSTDRVMGNNLLANKRTIAGVTNLDLSCTFTNLNDWLASVYKAMVVLNFDSNVAPPTPTHFRLRMQGSSVVRSCTIDQIISGVSNLSGTWVQGDTAICEFYSVNGSDTLELGALAYNVNVVS